jgi:NAD(P)-dependent dehydrogenase (short-subunit alcohol dehydrogenase family)
MSDVAVVTGAGSGIGRAIATKLVSDSIVILVDINPKSLAEVERELSTAGNKVFGLLGDVSLRETHKKARALAEEKGTLTSWVNCAGLTHGAPLHDFPNDPTFLDEIMAINQVGTFWGCAEAVASFVTGKVKGSVVNISSVHGRRAARDHAVYEMTKGAIDALTRNVASTYGPYGIRANAVAPGAVMTPALKEFLVKHGSKHRENLELLTPLKRLADPSEIAEVVSFLLSSKASYVSGQSLAVEGGWLASLGFGDLDPDLAKKYELKSENGLPL